MTGPVVQEDETKQRTRFVRLRRENVNKKAIALRAQGPSMGPEMLGLSDAGIAERACGAGVGGRQARRGTALNAHGL